MKSVLKNYNKTMASNNVTESISSEDELSPSEPASQSIPEPTGLIEINLGRKRVGPLLRHPVWAYFRETGIGGKKECILCKVKKFQTEFPTNVQTHLLLKHHEMKMEYEEMKKLYDEKIKRKKEESGGNQSIQRFYRTTKAKNESCTQKQKRLLALFISSTSIPFSIVSTVEFKDFCQSLLPNFGLPDKKTVLKEIGFVHSEMRKNIFEALESAGKISLCVDEWTKKGMKMAVIGVTAHIFNRKSQQLECILLGLRRIEHPHTAERIKELTYSILHEWSIPHEKVWRIITDNAKNITKAFQMVSLDGEDYVNANIDFIEEGSNRAATAVPVDPFLEEEDEEFDEDAVEEYVETELIELTFQKEKHLPCFIHTLVLAFKNMGDSNESEVFEAKQDARRLVTHFSRSSKATERLVDLSGKKLLMPSRTRWNYFYHMIGRLIELKEPVKKVCEEQGIDNIKNWGKLIQLVKVLKPFSQWIDYLQGEKYSTISCALPCLNVLLDHLTECMEGEDKILPELCKSIILEIRNRFKYILSINDESFNSTFIVAAALHPVLALKTLEEPQLFRAELQILARQEFEATSDNQQQETNIHDDNDNDLCGGLFHNYFKRKGVQAKQVAMATILSVDEEVNSYFKQLSNFSSVNDPLKFWIDKRSLFPTLSKLA